MLLSASLAALVLAASATRTGASPAQSPARIPCTDSTSVPAAGTLPWQRVLAGIGCDRTALASELTKAKEALTARGALEDPSLLPRIRQDPVPAAASGYGVVPGLLEDEGEKPVTLGETRYSLRVLSEGAQEDMRSASALNTRIDARDQPLPPLVTELERLRTRLQYLDNSIAYHRFWQKAAAEYTAFFSVRNRLVARARALRRLEDAGTDTATIRAIRRELAGGAAPFSPVPGLVLKREPNGTRTLPVTVVTDITDTTFLTAFERAVERTWNQSDAARARRFRIALRLDRVAPAALYPEGVPRTAAPVDEAKHLARFPKSAMVLTTGARSTHALKGAYVQLGGNAASPRVLAHEFGHLLGFDDGYLRGTEGDSADAFGYTIVEWTGILNDLMGAPGAGRVTTDMIDTLIAAYSRRSGK